MRPFNSSTRWRQLLRGHTRGSKIQARPRAGRKKRLLWLCVRTGIYRVQHKLAHAVPAVASARPHRNPKKKNSTIKNRPRRAFGKRPPAPIKPKGKPGRPFVGAHGGGSWRGDQPWVHSPRAEAPGLVKVGGQARSPRQRKSAITTAGDHDISCRNHNKNIPCGL